MSDSVSNSSGSGPATTANRVGWAGVILALASAVAAFVNFLENEQNQKWIQQTVSSVAILIPGIDAGQDPIDAADLSGAIKKVGKALSYLKLDQETYMTEQVEQAFDALDHQWRITDAIKKQFSVVGPQMREEDASIIFSTINQTQAAIRDDMCEIHRVIAKKLDLMEKSPSPGTGEIDDEQLDVGTKRQLLRERLIRLQGRIEGGQLSCESS
jgi:hypothetical protein